MMKPLLTLTYILSLITLTSCGLIQSDTRSLKLQVKNYETILSSNDWALATKMYSKDFVWIKNGKKYKGRSPMKAFHKSLKDIPSHDSMLVDVKLVKKMRAGKYLVTGFMQMRQSTAGTLRSVKWDMSMTWIKTKEGWQIIEINELNDRQNFSS